MKFTLNILLLITLIIFSGCSKNEEVRQTQMDYKGTIISKMVSDHQILVMDDIESEALKELSVDELTEKALSENKDVAWYTVDTTTFDKLQVGQNVGIEVSSKKQADSRPPIRTASTVVVIESTD